MEEFEASSEEEEASINLLPLSTKSLKESWGQVSLGGTLIPEVVGGGSGGGGSVDGGDVEDDDEDERS